MLDNKILLEKILKELNYDYDDNISEDKNQYEFK